jgi:hypothetical protein
MFIMALFIIAKLWNQPRCPSNNEENVAYVYKGVLLSHKEEQNCVICRKMDGTIDYHVKKNKPDSGGQILHAFYHMCNLEFKNTGHEGKR